MVRQNLTSKTAQQKSRRGASMKPTSSEDTRGYTEDARYMHGGERSKPPCLSVNEQPATAVKQTQTSRFHRHPFMQKEHIFLLERYTLLCVVICFFFCLSYHYHFPCGQVADLDEVNPCCGHWYRYLLSGVASCGNHPAIDSVDINPLATSPRNADAMVSG